jgi:hypothetical protein
MAVVHQVGIAPSFSMSYLVSETQSARMKRRIKGDTDL